MGLLNARKSSNIRVISIRIGVDSDPTIVEEDLDKEYLKYRVEVFAARSTLRGKAK